MRINYFHGSTVNKKIETTIILGLEDIDRLIKKQDVSYLDTTDDTKIIVKLDEKLLNGNYILLQTGKEQL